MKIAMLIPDRNDRPLLLQNCIRMMQAQTLKPAHIEIVNDAPLSDEKDITWRYRIGYERLKNKGFDVIALIENDDWYHPGYLEMMVAEWERQGKPDLLGSDYTIYYHLQLKAWFTMQHPLRSAAMNTLIKPDLEFHWCVDHDPYTDIHLWMHSGLKGKIFHPDIFSMGIKHLEGKHGGKNHTDNLHRYVNNDGNLSFLKEKLDNESFRFYSAYYSNC